MNVPGITFPLAGKGAGVHSAGVVPPRSVVLAAAWIASPRSWSETGSLPTDAALSTLSALPLLSSLVAHCTFWESFLPKFASVMTLGYLLLVRSKAEPKKHCVLTDCLQVVSWNADNALSNYPSVVSI